MVYGILQFINFAHSDVFMLGAWISYVVAVHLGWANLQGASRSVLVLTRRWCCWRHGLCGALGFIIERAGLPAAAPARRA